MDKVQLLTSLTLQWHTGILPVEQPVSSFLQDLVSTLDLLITIIKKINNFFFVECFTDKKCKKYIHNVTDKQNH